MTNDRRYHWLAPLGIALAIVLTVFLYSALRYDFSNRHRPPPPKPGWSFSMTAGLAVSRGLYHRGHWCLVIVNVHKVLAVRKRSNWEARAACYQSLPSLEGGRLLIAQGDFIDPQGRRCPGYEVFGSLNSPMEARTCPARR